MKTTFRFARAAICRILMAVALGVTQDTRANSDLLPGSDTKTSPDKAHLLDGESWVGAPLQVSVSDFAAALNAVAPKRFHAKESREVTRALVEDYVEYTVDRETISLQAEHGHLAFRIPVSGTVTVGGQVNPLHGIHIGRGKHVQQSAHVKGTLSGSLDLHLNSDWSVSPDLTLNVDFDQAEVRLFNSIPISIKGKLREAFDHNSAAIKNQIAEQLRSRAKLKENATNAWQRLHIAKQIAISPPTWVSVEPLDVVAAEISVSDEGQILSGFAVRCTVAGKIGDPPVPKQPTPLPALRIASHISTDCHIQFLLRADLDKIAATLNDRFSADAIPIGDKKAYLREIKLAAAQKKIRLEGLLRVEGEDLQQPFEARVILEGTPVMDAESDTIGIPDLTLNLPADDGVSTFASFFMASVTAELRRRTWYNYKADLERLRSLITHISPQLVGNEHLSLSVSAEQVEVRDLNVLSDSISIRALMSGKARLLLY